MTTPTHIRAWVAVDAEGNIYLSTTSETEESAKCYYMGDDNLENNLYAKVIPITIVLGHDLADQLEKVK